MCYSQTSQANNGRFRDRREQFSSTSTPKRSGTCFTMVWIIERRASDITQDLRQGHKSSIEAGKKSQGSIGPYNTPNTCKPEKDSQQKFTFHIYSAHVLFPNITSIKRQMQTRRVEVISTSTPKRGGTCFTMVWIIECRETDSLHKTCGKDTRLPSKQKKNLTRKHWAVEHAK